MMTREEFLKVMTLAVRRGTRTHHIVTRSKYPKERETKPGSWGSSVSLNQGAQTRLVDLSLPEPVPITLYMLQDTVSAGQNSGRWTIVWASGGAEFRTTVKPRAMGMVHHVVAAHVRVEVQHLATSPLTTIQATASAGIGTPTLVDHVEKGPNVPALGSATVDIPLWTRDVSVFSNDPDWAVPNAEIEFLDSTGTPTTFGTYGVLTRFAQHVPIDAEATQLRITSTLAGAIISDSTICWRMLT